MEIRHRKQWLTGKMVAQVRKDGKWRDADNDDADVAHVLIRWNESKIEELRSQLSEALGKIREYREENDCLKENISELKKTTVVDVDLRMRQARTHLKLAERYMKALTEKFADPDSDISKALRRNLSKPKPLDIPEFGNVPGEHGDSSIPPKPFLSPKLFATGGYVPGDKKYLAGAFAVPHHGPGLSEAEEAMRPAGVVGNNQQVLSQEEIAAAFGITPENILRDPTSPSYFDPITEKPLTLQEAIEHQNKQYSHYKKDITHLSMLDIYRVLSLFEVRSHAVGHAVKKLLVAGKRGSKEYEQDIREAVDSLNRELQMIAEGE